MPPQISLCGSNTHFPNGLHLDNNIYCFLWERVVYLRVTFFLDDISISFIRNTAAKFTKKKGEICNNIRKKYILRLPSTIVDSFMKNTHVLFSFRKYWIRKMLRARGILFVARDGADGKCGNLCRMAKKVLLFFRRAYL